MMFRNDDGGGDLTFVRMSTGAWHNPRIVHQPAAHSNLDISSAARKHEEAWRS